jgi:hypothetical protein
MSIDMSHTQMTREETEAVLDITRMHLTDLTEWYCLLVSGLYEQGRTYLRVDLDSANEYHGRPSAIGQDNVKPSTRLGYCCLGVYCDGKAAKGELPASFWQEHAHDTLLPEDVALSAGMGITAINPELAVVSETVYTAAELNDGMSWTFGQIAAELLREIRRRATERGDLPA